jgi:RNA polymerase sigma-70 factor (ECF subfamily)
MAPAKYSTLSDLEVFTLMQHSDHAAYTEIYYRYFHLLFRHAVRKLRNEDTAKDVVQDVFTNLWQKRSASKLESNLGGYLYTAVRYRVFNFWAGENVRSKYWDSFADDHEIAAYANASTDHLIRERQLNAYIEEQVRELPAKMRRIFELSRKELLSHREIAERLDTSEGNVSKQISNALKLLRPKLGGTITVSLIMLAWILLKSAGMLNSRSLPSFK